MPTPISTADKNAVIAIVAVMDPVEAVNLQTVLVNYEDVVNLVARQAVEFEYYPSYLTQVMACLTNAAALVAVGVYVNQSTVGANPNLIINSTVTGGVAISTNNNGLGIFNSTIDAITLSGTAQLSDLWIGSGSTVSLLNSSAAGTFVNNIWVRNIRTAPASLIAVAVGSNINPNGVYVDDGAYYGGITNNNPAAVCATPVTALTVSEITYTGLKLTWVPPASYLTVSLFFRESSSDEWDMASSEVGMFLPNDTGFVFKNLKKDISYKFKVIVTCINGGESTPELISAITIPTEGSKVSCAITILVKTTPNPAVTQTLANGAIIAKEYLAGTKVILANLIGAKNDINENFTINGALYQNFPFIDNEGAFDASATTMLTFNDGDIITVNVNLS